MGAYSLRRLPLLVALSDLRNNVRKYFPLMSSDILEHTYHEEREEKNRISRVGHRRSIIRETSFFAFFYVFAVTAGSGRTMPSSSLAHCGRLQESGRLVSRTAIQGLSLPLHPQR